MERRICEQCKKEELEKYQQKYCSKECEAKARIKWVDKICDFCKKRFQVKPQRTSKAKFCSHTCYWKFLVGKPSSRKGTRLSEEHRKKVAEKSIFQKGFTPWNKGRPHLSKEKHPLWGKHHSEESRKKMSESKKKLYEAGWQVWNYGKHHSEETKEKLRIARANQKNIPKGADHYFWKGGISPLKRRIRTSFKYRIWQKAIFQRDNYTCLHCGIRGGSLEADHIKPMAKILEQNTIKTFEDAMNCAELWDAQNGRTLCRDCHLHTDTWGRR